MKAFTTQGDGIAALVLEERDDPRPGPGQVLVKMSTVTLNYRDLLVVGGVGKWKPEARRIPLSDGVGVVVALGQEASLFSLGDRVAGLFLPKWQQGELTPESYAAPLGGATTDGVLAEFRVFDELAVVRVPEHLTDAQAASLPVAALTAWHAVDHRSNVQGGDKVLIQGTGGVSLFATQFVLAKGGLPLVTSSSDAKLVKARALGAWNTINYRTKPAWEEEVLRLTDGEGVHHVIEVVGGENLNRSLRAVKLGGTISFIGLMAGVSAPIDTYAFVTKSVRLHGIESGSRDMFKEMNRFIEAHRLRPVIDRVFPFLEAREALTYLESGAHFGKVAIAFRSTPPQAPVP